MRDIRERLADPEESLRESQDSHQSRIWTALPGEIVSFDPIKVTCVVQPTVKANLTAKDGTKKSVNMPLLLDCPVVFPGGGGFILTFPIAAGAEVLIVFASRCIDAWWQQGGVQTAPMFRMHDLSDGFAIPGPRSQAKLPGAISTTEVELRSEDSTMKISLNEATGELRLKAPGIIVDGPCTFMSNVDIQGAAVQHGGKNIGKTHTHSDPQGGTTGVVT